MTAKSGRRSHRYDRGRRFAPALGTRAHPGEGRGERRGRCPTRLTPITDSNASREISCSGFISSAAEKIPALVTSPLSPPNVSAALRMDSATAPSSETSAGSAIAARAPAFEEFRAHLLRRFPVAVKDAHGRSRSGPGAHTSSARFHSLPPVTTTARFSSPFMSAFTADSVEALCVSAKWVPWRRRADRWLTRCPTESPVGSLIKEHRAGRWRPNRRPRGEWFHGQSAHPGPSRKAIVLASSEAGCRPAEGDRKRPHRGAECGIVMEASEHRRLRGSRSHRVQADSEFGPIAAARLRTARARACLALT